MAILKCCLLSVFGAILFLEKRTIYENVEENEKKTKSNKTKRSKAKHMKNQQQQSFVPLIIIIAFILKLNLNAYATARQKTED